MDTCLNSSTSLSSLTIRLFAVWSILLSSCCDESADQQVDSADDPALALSAGSVDCNVTTATGYRDGTPYPVEIIHVDGQPVIKETANHYVAMQRAAASAGVRLTINEGFRTMAQQQYFWDCYQTKKCNKGTEAARPGYGNHQNGIALDIVLGSGVESWLRANGARFGFEARLANEPWHWERNHDGQSVEVCPGSAAGSDGCTDLERSNNAAYGCTCVDHRGNGGFCDGHGCTAVEEQNCAKFGTACVDHQCNGGFADGHGCTALEEKNCASVGTACVDHQCSGGFTDGHGCTALEEKNCASVATQCVDHQCSGGFTDGHGCTALEEKNCASVATQCVDHACSGGLGGVGNGCTALEQKHCDTNNQSCYDHVCVAR